MAQNLNSTIILEEEIDENYEPTYQEVILYAKYLDMQLPQDNQYLDIARDGLKTELPKKWKPCQKLINGEETIFYKKFQTNEITHEHPCDIIYKKKYQDAKIVEQQSNPKKALLDQPKKVLLDQPQQLQKRPDDQLASSCQNCKILQNKLNALSEKKQTVPQKEIELSTIAYWIRNINTIKVNFFSNVYTIRGLNNRFDGHLKIIDSTSVEILKKQMEKEINSLQDLIFESIQLLLIHDQLAEKKIKIRDGEEFNK